jgi:ribosome silencing factor RsfS/YbeB/iojap
MGGFIYIMSNPAFGNGLIKIGKSDRDPEEYRALELETTGVPEPFKVEYSAFVENHHELERFLHKYYDYCRWNRRREFFQVTSEEVVEVIRSNCRILFERADAVTTLTQSQKEERKRKAIKATALSTLKKAAAENVQCFKVPSEQNKVPLEIIVCSGRSNRPVANITMELTKAISAFSIEPDGLEGIPQADWVLVDYSSVGVVIHIFRIEVRPYYNIEEVISHEIKRLKDIKTVINSHNIFRKWQRIDYVNLIEIQKSKKHGS